MNGMSQITFGSNFTLGPIQLESKSKTTERTSAQIYTGLFHDSRITQQLYPLSYRKIRELREDPTCVLAKWAVLAPMIHTPWVYASSGTHGLVASKEMIRCVEDCMTPLRDWFLQQAVFSTLDYGWAPFETIYQPKNGRVEIENFKQLLVDYTQILVYLDNGQFAGFINEPWQPGYSVIIPEDYAININFQVEGTDWYGTSVFKSLQKIIDSWNAVEATATRYDKKIAGAAWVVYYPVGITTWRGKETPNDEIAIQILSTLEASGGVVIPDELQDWVDDAIDREAKGKWRIELMSADSATHMSFIDRQKYLDALKMRAFGFPERAILEGKHGTKEEADVHGDVALSIVDSKHRLLCNQLNTGPVEKILTVNFGKKWGRAVCVKPAPLVDSQFATIKEFYRLLLQTPDTLLQEAQNIDTKAMRDELGVPSSGVNKPIEPMPLETPKIEQQKGGTNGVLESSAA